MATRPVDAAARGATHSFAQYSFAQYSLMSCDVRARPIAGLRSDNVLRATFLAAALCVATDGAEAQVRAPAAARATIEPTAPRRAKPAQTRLEAFHQRDHVRVKFADGLVVRARGGELTDLGSGSLDEARAVLDRFAGGTWRRAHVVAEERLDELRQRARTRLARHVADLNLQFDFVLPPGVSAEEAIDAFNALECVELADAAPLPPPAPTPPDLTANQKYTWISPFGVSATLASTFAGTSGAGLRVCDVEYSFNASHVDLPPVTLLGAAVVDPFNTPQHGTAVLGVMAAQPNGFGITGIVPAASYHFAGANTVNGYHVDAGILAAVAAFSPGDLIIVEQQAFGPGNTLAPAEWDVTVYNAIVTAVGNGISVVEPAGNGGQNLDAPAYSTGNGGHWPFLPQNDSGAILVGAGASPLGTSVDRSRLTFSNYGATLDLQGWGELVTTTGFGPAYSAEGSNAYYTNTFNGTSSATPMVAAACLQLQGAHKARFGTVLSPQALRDALRASGAPQTDGVNPATQNIGPRPDAAAAIQALSLGAAVTTCAGDGRATACPCANDSTSNGGRGCRNSLALSATLVTSGVASLAQDTLVLTTEQMQPTATMAFLQGSTLDGGGAGVVFGDGLRCAGGTVVRLATMAADAQGACAYPAGARPPVSVRGQVGAPGTRHYQVLYRDDSTVFCGAATFNATNGVSVAWSP